MSAHDLLNLLIEFGKSDKMRGLSSILIHFLNECNKFRVCHLLYNVIMDVITFPENL